MHSGVQRSFDHFGLHTAATAGDDDGIRRAFELGADVNGLDAAGRTAFMCAVAGEDWQNMDASDASFMTAKRLNAIRLILSHPDVSLYTLNAPQNSMNGVIPLGMAAWLNMPNTVRMLLDESVDSVAVDGMDCNGATALMYAARDGSLEVVQILLSHGARPDFRDCNHRTSIQFALAHPQILWLCESVLRRHRWRESHSADRSKLFASSDDLLTLTSSSLPPDNLEPPPLSIFSGQAISKLTDTLISSVTSSDLAFLQSLLFAPPVSPSAPPALYPMSAPILVNRPDSQGWSPIHYCAAAKHPSISILDALYCAGADVALFTTNEQYTPLHVLAHSSHLCVESSEHASSLYQFTVHLIHDLRAPLSARDKNDETCIHIAAEHGCCINLLLFFLDCDTTCSVRELRNSRGLTALEVAKPEFRVAFGGDMERTRPISSLSSRTIRPVNSYASLASLSEWTSATSDDIIPLYASSTDFDIDESLLQMLNSLSITSPSVDHATESVHLDHLHSLTIQASQDSQRIFAYFRSRVQDAVKELEDLRMNCGKVDTFLDLVSRSATSQAARCGVNYSQSRAGARDSEDSQKTAVSSQGLDLAKNQSGAQISKSEALDDFHISVATQTIILDLLPFENFSGLDWSDWLDKCALPADGSTCKALFGQLADVERELAFIQQKLASYAEPCSPGMETRIKHLTKKRKKLEDKIKDLSLEKRVDKKEHGTGRIKAWFKRIIAADRPAKLEIVKAIDEKVCPVGREVKVHPSPYQAFDLNVSDACIDAALRSSHLVLEAAKRDLLMVSHCLSTVQQSIESVNHSISKAERIIKRAVKKREVLIANLRQVGNSSDRREGGSPGVLRYNNYLTLKPSLASISSACSAQSCASIAATVIENDDEDVRALRRLLKRKIGPSIVTSWDDMDHVTEWIKIVREVVRGVKRRAYL